MASASLVQVIDLTDSPPHIDTTLRKSPDYNTKTTTKQTSRKRRNGETGRTLAESRDSSAEEEYTKSEEVIEIPQAEGSKGGNGESTKKRSRRSKKSKDKGKDLLSSSLEDVQQDLPPTSKHDQLFFVDTTPAAIPAGMVFDSRGADTPQSPSTSRAPEADKTPALLLPAHVSVLGAVDGEPIQIVQPVDSDSDAESYIEYLDYDDRLVRMSHSLLRFIAHCMQTAGTVRYFETPADEQKQARFICKRCGAESEHRTRECPIMIVREYFFELLSMRFRATCLNQCLTCGARDEHSTRSCPISKTCFTCGMKGHINKVCRIALGSLLTSSTDHTLVIA